MNRWELLSFSDDHTLVDEAVTRWLSLSASAKASPPFLGAHADLIPAKPPLPLSPREGRAGREYGERGFLTLESGPYEPPHPQPSPLLNRGGEGEEPGAVPRRTPFLVALSGGRIPQNLYKAIAQNYSDQAHLLQALHFFWSDERCVPPDSPDSNFAAANELLLKPLNIPEARTHRIRGEVGPGQAIAQIEHDLAHLASKDGAGLPVFDLIFLGMGEDGHVASLFPGQLAEDELKGTVYRQVIGPKPPPLRISLSYQVIASAKQVWVLISGKGKEDALKQSLSGPSTPLGKVLAMRSQTLLFSSVALT